MLAKLRKFDQKTRAGILAGLAQELLPSPGLVRTPTPDGVSKDLYVQLIEEMRRELRIPHDDQSASSQQKLFRFLNTQLRETLLKPQEIKEIKERVGEKGVLRPDLYKIQFQDTFEEISQKFGVTKDAARHAVLHSTMTEHLLPEMFGQENGQGKSLFVESKDGKDPHSLLIQCDRKKDVLSIGDGWLIYHGDVDVSKARSPVGLLGAFVEKYGINIRVAGGPETKFLLYESFENIALDQKLEFAHDPSSNLFTTFSFRRSGTKLEVALAFVIDMARYAEDLEKHGVHVKLEPIK